MKFCHEITVSRRRYSADRHTHSHTFAQLILPLQGELSIQSGEADLTVDQRMLFFIPPHSDHTFCSAASNEFLVIDIPAVMIAPGILQQKAAAYTFDNKWHGIRTLILHELDQYGAHSKSLQQLYPYISHYLLQTRQPASIAYIHEHYDQPLNVQRLAELEHYNRSYYYDWFQKMTGHTPASYIQEVRLAKAKELLQSTSLSVMQIAIQVGLEHQSSLTRIFRQKEKVTPSQYRQQYRL
ncbi:helix-turn-helix domain-containing protein [Paenibacillus sp. GCM10027626]|uniref:AraC family transcriptional regulator n=1 Tax=Paenibacillus sp. GCM10027626 TaxID=3273411 RepID=UPI0036349F32